MEGKRRKGKKGEEKGREGEKGKEMDALPLFIFLNMLLVKVPKSFRK